MSDKAVADDSKPCAGCTHDLSAHQRSFLGPVECLGDLGRCACQQYLRPDGEMWSLDHSAEPVLGQQVEGPSLLVNVHPASACEAQNCCLHNPSDHPLKDAPLNWREDRRIMERFCVHRIGHPDPDDAAYRASTGDGDTVHGCDGCCSGPPTEVGTSATPQAADLGTDLLGGAIYGASPYGDEREHAEKFARRFSSTPVFSEVPPGSHMHIGQGVFLHRCPKCPAYVRSYGGIVYVPAYDEHLRDEHGIVTGPLLPPSRPDQQEQ